jgi:hypothetical protein
MNQHIMFESAYHFHNEGFSSVSYTCPRQQKCASAWTASERIKTTTAESRKKCYAAQLQTISTFPNVSFDGSFGSIESPY